jgi:cytochrome c biogenesis protein CcmG/thiol:disulfide interchange protein DsbE
MIRRLLPLGIFLALAALLWFGVRTHAGRDTSAIASPLIGKPAPAFSLPVLGQPGRVVSGADLRGKPYLLNVWGSWCVNCQQEHPVITALAASGRVRVLGYNYKDAPADAGAWLAKLGDPYEFSIADEEGRAALDWGIYGAPETFLVDAGGVVRWKFVGPLDEAVVRDQLMPQLARLGAAP